MTMLATKPQYMILCSLIVIIHRPVVAVIAINANDPQRSLRRKSAPQNPAAVIVAKPFTAKSGVGRDGRWLSAEPKFCRNI